MGRRALRDGTFPADGRTAAGFHVSRGVAEINFAESKITRKELLKLGLPGSAALVLPMERVARTRLAIANRIPESQLPRPFQSPFVRPPFLRPVKRDATTIYGYNGITPGPTIKVNQGRKTVVRQINRLPEVSVVGSYKPWTSVHLHGSDSLPQYDGYASDITSPGEFKDYRYPNNQPARTLWYHDHGAHHTAENAYMGLAAQYHLHDEQELGLPIPHGRYDVPLIIQDKIFAQNGDFIYDDQGHSSIYGDVILVNGRPWPVMKVERWKYRFRVLDASVSRS